jgi:hypothetical protein
VSASVNRRERLLVRTLPPRTAGSEASAGAIVVLKQERGRETLALLGWTTSGSATWPDPLRPVHRHDVGVCELPIGGSSSTVAVVMRQMR